MLPIIYMLWSIECFDFSVLLFKEFCFIVNFIECFYVNDEPESKFLYTETIKLYCIVLYCMGE